MSMINYFKWMFRIYRARGMGLIRSSALAASDALRTTPF